MNKWKKEIIDMAHYTIDPINLKILLTPSENTFLNTLMYFEDIKQMYVSLSVLEIYNSMSRPTVLKTKLNLIQLDFIEIVKDTQKGTIYQIKWENITNILKQLSSENNVIKRLIICDEYRINKGMTETNKKNISKYKNTPFDIESNKTDENIIEANEDKKKFIKVEKDPLIIQINEIQKNLNNVDIDLNDKNKYNNELNRLKGIAKSKNKIITYDKTLQTWKTKK